MDSSPGVNFNFQSTDFDGGGSFFKSSFARTMAFDSAQSKSLDFMYFDRATNISEESAEESEADRERSGAKFSRCVSPSGYARVNGYRKFRSRSGSDAAKFWKRKQDSFRKEHSLDRQDSSGREESLEEELIRLRKERDHLLEENRRLQGERSESPTLLEVSAYQSQMDTLQWQLKHVESNRQMYRAVMEQVLKFLERVQKCLDLIQVNKSTNPNQSPNKNRSRVPRSRSVHTVAHTSPNSRTSSPSPTHQSYHSAHQVQRANSVNHMQDSYSHPLREFSWRSARPLHQIEDVVTPEKLSQDTFRLLRTIQSLVNTREPDLTSHLTPSSSDLTLSRPAPDTNSVGSCSSLLHSSYTGGGGVGSGDSTRKSLESSSSCSTHCDDLDILASSSPRGRVKSSPSVPHGTEDELSWGRVKSSPPVPHGTEDESGFSSLSSFHESGLPETRGYQELGLPLVESLETRWQPPPHAPPLNERIRVLWV